MPVTAKLSRKFYDALGDDVANELVEWFNAVDLTYRSDLERVNELSWTRFEARLNEGLTGLRADLRQELAADRMAVEALASKVRIEMATLKADLIKWMFLFWLGTVAANLASKLF
jgi:hypothetical protein